MRNLYFLSRFFNESVVIFISIRKVYHKRNTLKSGKQDDFYIFAGCDGYRSIFSWSEIYRTENGRKMILLPGKKGLTFGPVADCFVDRDIRALSCVEKVKL